MPQPFEQLVLALADRYEFERELGRGGMAIVYLARDIKHDRHVAIKALLPDLSLALGPERFRREIALASHLSHPHILPIYDSGDADGQLYYVMPYVVGESLRDRLDQQRQLPVDEALRITCEIASALAHAHKQGVVHRDIKPENILLEDGQALVADFGIARAVSAVGSEKLTKTGVSLGTPAYMSPEQAMADPNVDPRSDVYSLGCVLYEMLAGVPPFTGPTAQAIIARHALDQVPSLTVVRGTISDDVEDAVLRAMSKVPADRFATATDFAEALTACQRTGPRSLRRSGRHLRGRKAWQSPGRRAIGLRVAVAALTVAGFGWAAWWLSGGGLQSQVDSGGFAFNPKRIAVLYFADESPGGALGYLADGLTEGLIDELRPVVALDVVSRNGVAQFRGKSLPTDSIAALLQAGTIVEGSVDRVRDRVLVSVRLIEGNTGTVIARTAVERPESEALAVRDSLPAAVARLLRERLRDEIRLRDSRAETTNPTAWLVLQRAERARKDARALAAADSGEAALLRLAHADSLLGEAESLDPRWSRPILSRAGLALNRTLATRDNAVRGELIAVGLGHIERALALDAQNAEGLELRGTLRYLKRFFNLALDPAEAATLMRTAEEDLRTASRIDPSRASAWNTLSLLLYRKLDRLGAYQAAYRAYEEDAYLESAREILWRLYGISYDLENFESASQWCEAGNKRYPADALFASCRLWLMTSNRPGSTPDAAWAAFREIARRTPPSRWEAQRRQYEMLVAVPIARTGRLDSARNVIERARAGRDVDPGGELIGREVLVRTLIGDTDQALDLLESYLAAFPQHREGFVRGNTWWWRPLQGDQRFKELVGG